jgi:hypothetical protein
MAAQNRKRDPKFPAWLRGSVEFVAMLNPAHGQRLKERLANLRGTPSDGP